MGLNCIFISFSEPLAYSSVNSFKWRSVDGRLFSTNALRLQSAQPAVAATGTQTKHASLKVDNGVAIITLDSPGVKMNSLNQEVMRDMETIFNEVQSRPDIKAAVLISGLS